MIRYRTRDLTSCCRPVPCGPDGPRMQRVTPPPPRHADHQGSQRLPSQIEHVLFEIEGRSRTTDRHRCGRRDGRATVLVEAGNRSSSTRCGARGDGGYDPETAGARTWDTVSVRARGKEDPSRASRGRRSASSTQETVGVIMGFGRCNVVATPLGKPGGQSLSAPCAVLKEAPIIACEGQPPHGESC